MLKQAGLGLEILSGDRRGAVSHVAASLAIPDWHAALLPQEKLARIKALADGGRKALMVGDGLNDAPALQAAHVSMAPHRSAIRWTDTSQRGLRWGRSEPAIEPAAGGAETRPTATARAVAKTMATLLLKWSIQRKSTSPVMAGHELSCAMSLN